MNKESATKAKEEIFGSLDNAISYLEECRNKGMNVYIDFNGTRLYSCDTTIISGYLSVMGMSKGEYDEFIRRLDQAGLEEEKEQIVSEFNERKKAGLDSLLKNEKELSESSPFAAPSTAEKGEGYKDFSGVDYHPKSTPTTEPTVQEFVEVSTEPTMEQNLSDLSLEELESYKKTGKLPTKTDSPNIENSHTNLL